MVVVFFFAVVVVVVVNMLFAKVKAKKGKGGGEDNETLSNTSTRPGSTCGSNDEEDNTGKMSSFDDALAEKRYLFSLLKRSLQQLS